MNELNNFFLGVQQVAQDAVDKAPYDRTFRGVIEEINGDGTCNVRINGRTYENIPCNQSLEVDEVIDVLFPQNNPSLMKIVNVPFDYSETWNDDLNVNGNIYIQGVKMVDYIIDQGTSDMWTYRKWNSGIAECWLTNGSIISDVPIEMTPNGTLYESNVMTIAMPNNLFVDVPNVSIDTMQGGGMWAKATGSTTKDDIKYEILRTNNTKLSVKMSIQCKGRWK